MTYTHTYAILDVSQATYDEIADKLRDAGYREAFIEQRDGRVAINMHGIAIAAEQFHGPVQPPPLPFTISKIPLRITTGGLTPLDMTDKEVVCLVCNEPVEIVDALGGRVLPHVHDNKYASIELRHPDGTLQQLDIDLVWRPQ